VTYLRVNSDITIKEMAKTISRFLNNIVLKLNRILNKALKTYRLFIAP
jgi:predicted NodU family carbamoyl transferase